MTTKTVITRSVVPAQPGFFCLEYGAGEDELDAIKHPVVAWMVIQEDGRDINDKESCSYYVHPIVPDWGYQQQITEGNDYTLMQPDGTVVIPGNIHFPSIENWKEWQVHKKINSGE